MSKPKVALPLLAGAALLGVLWFSFRDHVLDLAPVQQQPAAAASPAPVDSHR